MATTAVTIEADANGKPLEVLSDLIEKRRAAMNETTAQAVTATAINILKSTRAATPVASTANARSGFIVDARTSLVPGFKSAPGAKSGRRVVRAEGGHEITSLKTINLAGQYAKGESVLAFICVFKYRQIRLGGDTEKYDRFYVIAKSKADVEKWAKRKIEYFINLYKGQAKWVLGQAMSRVSQQGYASEEQLSKLARRVGEGALSVKVANRGYNSGSQMVQIAGIAYLDKFDHYVKEVLREKYYLHYMDDGRIIIAPDADEKELLGKIAAKLAEVGLKLHPKKTRVVTADKGVLFLGFSCRVTETGKVLMLRDPAQVKAIRRKYRRLANRVKYGRSEIEDLDNSYRCVRSFMSKGNSRRLIQRMDNFVNNLKKEVANA